MAGSAAIATARTARLRITTRPGRAGGRPALSGGGDATVEGYHLPRRSPGAKAGLRDGSLYCARLAAWFRYPPRPVRSERAAGLVTGSGCASLRQFSAPNQFDLDPRQVLSLHER